MNSRSAGAGRDGKLRELLESIRESADFIRVTGDSDDVITSGRSILADVRQIDELLAVPDPLASDTGQGERPTLAQALERQVAMALRASEMAGMKPDEKAFYEGKAAGIRQALNSVRISASAPLASSSETQGETCSRCKGSGNEPEAGFADSPCTDCKGSGSVPVRASKEQK